MDDWVKILLVVLAALFVLPVAVLLLFVPLVGGMMYGYGTPMMGGMGGYAVGGGWGLGLVLLVIPLLLLGVLAYLVVALVRGSGGGRDRAQRELREAYARGDLTTEEFEERRDRLEE